MAAYYLFDMHVANMAGARLVDTITTSEPGEELRVDGLTPIRIPDGVYVGTPANLAELLQRKYVGILAQYPGFSHVVYDDLLVADDVVSSSRGTKLGARASIAGGFESVAVDVSDVTTAIAQFVLVYEHFTWRYEIPRDGHIQRYYVEEPEAAHRARVSVNGGGAYAITSSGSLVAVEPSEQGTTVRVELIPFATEVVDAATQRRVVSSGSWALLF